MEFTVWISAKDLIKASSWKIFGAVKVVRVLFCFNQSFRGSATFAFD